MTVDAPAPNVEFDARASVVMVTFWRDRNCRRRWDSRSRSVRTPSTITRFDSAEYGTIDMDNLIRRHAERSPPLFECGTHRCAVEDGGL